jgi:hypothetical protein
LKTGQDKSEDFGCYKRFTEEKLSESLLFFDKKGMEEIRQILCDPNR